MEKQLLVRLEQPWSSTDVGAFLDAAKLGEILPLFNFMEPSAKVRLLMALQAAQQELIRQHLSRERHLNPNGASMSTNAVISSAGLPSHLLKQILSLADSDSDEWVKITAGLVRQMLFHSTLGDEDDFLLESIKSTLDQVLSKMETCNVGDVAIDDWFSYDMPYLNSSHPKVNKGFKTANDHFVVVEEEKKLSDEKSTTSSFTARAPTLNRRPSSVVTAPGSSGPKVPKPTVTPTSAIGSILSKRSLTDVSTEVRRQAESGRFKRQRNRISMIDIDEIKQLESEKAQKAEERKQLARRASKAMATASTDANTSANPDTEQSGEGNAPQATETQAQGAEVTESYDAGNTLSEVAEVMQNYQDYNQLMTYDMGGSDASSFVVQEGLQHYDQTNQRIYQQQQQHLQQQPQQQQNNAAFGEPIAYSQYMDPQQNYNSNTMSNYEEARAALLQMQQSNNPNNQGGEYQYNGGFIDSANYWR